MIDITIVGAGVHGTRMVGKYKKCKVARVRAVVSNRQPATEVWAGVPFFVSAKEWKKHFGKPDKKDVFDINVHQDALLQLIKEFVNIGAKNFILPKPIALQHADLTTLNVLRERHKLNILIASQWHYSSLVSTIARFIRKNKKNIKLVNINFSAPVGSERHSNATRSFLPHILQILTDISLVDAISVPLIEHLSEKKIKFHYTGDIAVHVESDLTVPTRTLLLEVYLKGENKPAFVANFATEHTREDVLEKMIAQTVHHFEKPAKIKSVLTLSSYQPIAEQLVRILEIDRKEVAVIGGGIFGILSALEIAKKGYPVVIFEKELDIITGASLINQCRIHMGYHYPRDERTAIYSNATGRVFKKFFAPAIRNINNYYFIGKEGSLTSPKSFLAFCKKMRLPYRVSWPKGVNISKAKIALSVKVPEAIFDAHSLRKILKQMLTQTENVTLITDSAVVGLTQMHGVFNLTYQTGATIEHARFAAIVNATYSAANDINKLIGLPLAPYQYETIELLVVKTPWKGIGWGMFDGPFLGAIPFGFSDVHLMYDVEISVLERVIGALPMFTHTHAYHNESRRLARRLEEYYAKWESILPDIRKYKYLYSLYVTRMVLPNVEKTDARPTLTHELMPGMWQLFSGKITTSISQAKEVAKSVDAFLRSV